MKEKQPLCRRCMLEESIKGIDATIDQYIASLDESVKSDDREYERRLGICLDCSQMQNGLCRMCGCFVKARAAKKDMSCPSVSPKW